MWWARSQEPARRCRPARRPRQPGRRAVRTRARRRCRQQPRPPRSRGHAGRTVIGGAAAPRGGQARPAGGSVPGHERPAGAPARLSSRPAPPSGDPARRSPAAGLGRHVPRDAGRVVELGHGIGGAIDRLACGTGSRHGRRPPATAGAGRQPLEDLPRELASTRDVAGVETGADPAEVGSQAGRVGACVQGCGRYPQACHVRRPRHGGPSGRVLPGVP